MAQTVWVFAWPILAVQPSAVSCRLSSVFPSLRRKSTPPGPILELYLIESAKNDSSATMRLLRSDFIAATRSASSPSGVIAAAATTPFCTTGTGLDRFVLVPSPSCPSPLDPQQYAAPLGVTPQVCRPPALTATNGRPPATGTGLDWLVVVPAPSWPSGLRTRQSAGSPPVTL